MIARFKYGLPWVCGMSFFHGFNGIDCDKEYQKELCKYIKNYVTYEPVSYGNSEPEDHFFVTRPLMCQLNSKEEERGWGKFITSLGFVCIESWFNSVHTEHKNKNGIYILKSVSQLTEEYKTLLSTLDKYL